MFKLNPPLAFSLKVRGVVRGGLWEAPTCAVPTGKKKI